MTESTWASRLKKVWDVQDKFHCRHFVNMAAEEKEIVAVEYANAMREAVESLGHEFSGESWERHRKQKFIALCLQRKTETPDVPGGQGGINGN